MRGIAVALLAVAACRAPAGGPYQSGDDGQRNTARAEALTREAADWIYEDPDHAEGLLREALSADLFHGPAHNNLGVLFLERGELYAAAQEFEWARRLLPGSPDPRINLAIALERAGQELEAIATWRAALEAAPEDVGAIQGLAAAAIRHGTEEAPLANWLEVVAIRGESDAWRTWARSSIAGL